MVDTVVAAMSRVVFAEFIALTFIFERAYGPCWDLPVD
jgi:hypothetical protein